MDTKTARALKVLASLMDEEEQSENGIELEKQHGFAGWSGEQLVNRKYELKSANDSIHADNWDTVSEETRFMADEYLAISSYLRTPQGKAKEAQYLAYLKQLQADFEPLEALKNKTVKVVKAFDAVRSHSPRVGSIGKVVNQSLYVDIDHNHFDMYLLVWVRFDFPVFTDDEMVIRSDKFEAMSDESMKEMREKHNVSGIWSSREGETGLEVAYKITEIQVI